MILWAFQKRDCFVSAFPLGLFVALRLFCIKLQMQSLKSRRGKKGEQGSACVLSIRACGCHLHCALLRWHFNWSFYTHTRWVVCGCVCERVCVCEAICACVWHIKVLNGHCRFVCFCPFFLLSLLFLLLLACYAYQMNETSTSSSTCRGRKWERVGGGIAVARVHHYNWNMTPEI